MPALSSPTPATRSANAVRFMPIVHLCTGETVTLLAETQRRFEDSVAFGPASRTAERARAATLSPAEWLADHIESVAHDAHHRTEARPIIVSAPLAALIDPDTAMLCDAAIRRTPICAQEICIEISDADLAVPNTNSQAGVEALRRLGFRVSLNATRSCEAKLSSSLRLLLDSIRIDARKLELEEELEHRVEAAQACGMSVIAEHAHWRDGEYLASLGIDLALRPKTDS